MFKFSVLKLLLFIIPYVILYAVYIQLNGEVSPGGGFQAGVIFASSIVAYDLINGSSAIYNLISQKTLIICGVLGVLIYASCGLLSFIVGDNYLNYNSLAMGSNGNIGQHIGIFIVELGVGITVSAIMCLIYLSLKQ